MIIFFFFWIKTVPWCSLLMNASSWWQVEITGLGCLPMSRWDKNWVRADLISGPVSPPKAPLWFSLRNNINFIICLCDSSPQLCVQTSWALDVVTYLPVPNERGEAHCSFLIGVSPLRQTSVPELEPTAAAVAVKIDEITRDPSRNPRSALIIPQCWDIVDVDARFKTWFANRVSLIRDHWKVSEQRYVNSELNPADYTCRRKKESHFLSNKSWIQGLDFLGKGCNYCPTSPISLKGLYFTKLNIKNNFIFTMLVCGKGNIYSEQCNYFVKQLHDSFKRSYSLCFKAGRELKGSQCSELW